MPGVPPFKREHTVDVSLERIQDNAQALHRALGLIQILDGKLVGPVTIDATSTVVHHALGRAPRGAFVIDLRGDARVWRPSTQPVDATQDMHMQASSSVTATLWVW